MAEDKFYKFPGSLSSDDIDDLIEEQESQSLRDPEDPGMSVYEFYERYRVSEYLKQNILSAYKRAVGRHPSDLLNDAEQDAVLKGTKIYKSINPRGDFEVVISYTRPDGSPGNWIITEDADIITQKN